MVQVAGVDAGSQRAMLSGTAMGERRRLGSRDGIAASSGGLKKCVRARDASEGRQVHAPRSALQFGVSRMCAGT
jgi:hypothetical protein